MIEQNFCFTRDRLNKRQPESNTKLDVSPREQLGKRIWQ